MTPPTSMEIQTSLPLLLLPSNSLNRLLVALRDIKKHFGHKDPMPYCCTLVDVLLGTRGKLAVNMAALGESGDRVLYAF